MENTVLCWQHFSRLVPVVLGGSVGNGYTLHIFRPTLSSAVHIDSKVSQMIENASNATVTENLNCCNYPVTSSSH